MNILESLLNAQGSGVQQLMGQQIGQQLGQQFGLTASQTQAALGALLPALAGAVNQNMRAPGGLEGLLGALGNGQHGRYLEQPDLLGQPQTVQDGNGILGHLLGGKEVSRELASRASAQSGIGADILRKMLPVLATVVMGGLARQMSGGGAAMGGSPGGGLNSGASGGMGGLAGLASALGGGAASGQRGSTPAGGGLMDMLTPLLDRNRDGSAMDDVLKMAAGFLTRR